MRIHFEPVSKPWKTTSRCVALLLARARRRLAGKATGPLVSAEALGDAIDREVKEGLAYMFWGRLVALGTLALGAVLAVPLDRSGLYVAAIVAFGLLNALSFGLARSSRFATVATWSFVVIDAAILTYIFVTPSPFAVEGWTSQLNLRLPNFLYLGVFLVSMALTYSPALVVWSGAVTIVVWTIAYCWVATRPDSIAYGRDLLDGGLSDAEIIALVLDPRSVSLINLSYQTMFLVLVTIILAIAVWRSRRLVRKQVAAEAQRSALSRYFSPNIVRELSSGTSGFGEPSLQTAAILFADMVGFTRISEGLAPGDLVKLLKEYHARLATVAFAHGGTVDKYIGDEIMVHFGTPRPRKDDAARALACARDMLEQVRQWNEQRLASGEHAIEVGIGVHYGEVIVGNIGDERRLEYTVLGDTVNVASRLERLTRKIGTSLAVSEDLLIAAQAQSANLGPAIEELRPDQMHFVRGRRRPIAVWYLPRAHKHEGRGVASRRQHSVPSQSKQVDHILPVTGTTTFDISKRLPPP